MSSQSRLPALFALGLAAMGALAQAPTEPTTTTSTVTVYAAEFFAASRTHSAFDMLALLPGYQFVEADTDQRGLASASGNVLIDGARPASKYESLEAILRRIPSESVARIELVRAGTPGIDMRGHSTLANVVRARNAALRGSVEVSDAFYERGFDAPRLAIEIEQNVAARVIELSGSIARTVDDEHGTGHRPRVSLQGQLLRDGRYTQDEGEQVAEAAAGYENRALGGTLRLHVSAQQTRFGAEILDEVTLPAHRIATVSEFEREDDAEIGASFERAFSSASQWELTGLHHEVRARGGERAVEEDEQSLFSEESAAAESILRALIRHKGTALTLEGGVEMALNSFDSQSRLSENESEVSIPSAEVAIEERRTEAFATATWSLSTAWHLELGARFEHSELTQSGALRKYFFFPKPRMLLTWSPGTTQVRVLIERSVGQLDFEDFSSSASLSTGTVTAGNPDLEPDRTWRTEVSWERPLFDSGGIKIAARHDIIDALIDRVPVVADTTFDAIGNIGSGERDELEIDVTLPMDSLGMTAAVLKAHALWRRSDAVDPVTGLSRSISEEAPLEGAVQFLQPLPRFRARWGMELTLPTLEREYRFDEVRTDRVCTMLNTFIEGAPARAWNVRVFVNNLMDRSVERRRAVYDGLRNEATVQYIETRTLEIGRYFGIKVQRAFGG